MLKRQATPKTPRRIVTLILTLIVVTVVISYADFIREHYSTHVIAFEDVAPKVGLEFTQRSGRSNRRQLPETMSGGVALLDYDRDGWLDVYAVQGGRFPLGHEAGGSGDHLFHNRGDGTFEDATRSAGLSGRARSYGHGVAVGDFDNDGFPDLFLTRWRSYALYRNRRDGTFQDVTEQVGLGGDRDWPTSAAWADLDNDGDLDLYVCHYVVWDDRNPKICRHPSFPTPIYCPPHSLKSRPDHVFRNDKYKFTDITADSGVLDRDGRGLGVVAAHLDEDDLIDLYVANDATANFLFRNLGNLHFEDRALAAGAASSADGTFLAGMGVSCGDVDRDGRFDLAVTNFFSESTSLYKNLGEGAFTDVTHLVGIAQASRDRLGFGIAFLDYNCDGILDIATANGHVNDLRPGAPYPMRPQLLAGTSEGLYIDVTGQAGQAWLVPRVGRGLATGDIDNDGRIDLLMVAQNEKMAVLKNRTSGGHFLTLRLEGTSSNHDAVGARLKIRAGGREQYFQRFGGGSYQSSSDPRIHVGLGASRRADLVEIRWPSGRIDRHVGLRADRGYHLREGDPDSSVLPGFAR